MILLTELASSAPLESKIGVQFATIPAHLEYMFIKLLSIADLFI